MAGALEAFSENLKEKDIQIKLGPSGVHINHGVNWDDGAHQRIEMILIGYSDKDGVHDIQYGINYIQTVYSDSDYIQRLGPRHGRNNATSFKMINITKPVTRIDATYEYYRSKNNSITRSSITSLEFSSREGSYGLIGRKSDYSFTFESDLGFSGFHGRADYDTLQTLGVYINTSAKEYVSPSSN